MPAPSICSGRTVADVKTFLQKRLRHFTFAWFTVPMSTGGIALVLGQLPFRFRGLDTIGLIFYMVDVILFFAVVTAMVLRYTIAGASITYTIKHPTESLFMPTSQLAFATIIMGMGIYAEPHTGPWCGKAMLVCFWIFTAVAAIQAPLQFFTLFTIESHTTNHSTRNLSPGFILPIFPSMLVGTIANSVIKYENQSDGFAIAIAGLTFQGLGFMVSCFVYALVIRKLMQFGLPEPSHRTGLFICAGPPGFTGLALLGMARNAKLFLPPGMFIDTDPADLLLVLGILAAVFLWQLSAFWWLLASMSVLAALIEDRASGKHFHFSMSWWATIFPISGFCISTIYIGQALESKAIMWFATGMGIYLVVAYLTILGFMIEAVLSKRILWEGHDEDKPVPLLGIIEVADKPRTSTQEERLLRVAEDEQRSKWQAGHDSEVQTPSTFVTSRDEEGILGQQKEEA